MTKKQLENLLTLKENLRTATINLQHIQDSIHPGAQRMDGMPHASIVSDSVGTMAVEIAFLSDRIEQLGEQIKQEEVAANEFISQIEDADTYMIFRYRIIYGMTWKEISVRMGRYRFTINACQLRYYKFWSDFAEKRTEELGRIKTGS